MRSKTSSVVRSARRAFRPSRVAVLVSAATAEDRFGGGDEILITAFVDGFFDVQQYFDTQRTHVIPQDSHKGQELAPRHARDSDIEERCIMNSNFAVLDCGFHAPNIVTAPRLSMGQNLKMATIV